MMRRALPLLFYVATASGQVEIPPVTEIVEVRVIELDVIVTNPEGKRVKGLSRGDFEIREEGKVQEITNFSEVTQTSASERVPDAAASTELEPRRIVMFVDTLTTHPFQRKRLTQSLVGFLESNLRPADEAMLVSWNRFVKVVVPPTNDRKKLSEGLNEVARDVSIGPGSSFWEDQALTSPEDRRRARQHARSIANDVKLAASAVNSVLGKLAGVNGRKILILITEGLDMQPGIELMVSEGDESEARAYLEAEELHSGPLVDSITRAANAAGVTVYALHGAGLISGMMTTTSSPLASRARTRAIANSVDSLKLIAGSTGGMVVSDTNDFTAALNEIGNDLASYYSLGYRSSAKRIDRSRKIEVHARDPRFTVRTRQAVVEKSLETEVRDQVIANMFFPPSSNDMGIVVTVGEVKSEKRNRLSVPIKIRIPITLLTFRGDEQAVEADISVFLASSDEKHTLSSVQKLEHTIRVPRAEFAKAGAKHYTYGVDLELATASKRNVVSLAVVDNLSQATGFAVLTIN